MASRGALGGLAHNTAAFATILDGAGYDIIIIETVGAGQAEVNIASLAHTVIVVEAPGMGDDIQAIKAGILEIADIIVVNKADRPGAENTARALKAMLEMASGNTRQYEKAGKHIRRAQYEKEKNLKQAPEQHVWKTPVQLVTAVEGKGVEEVVEQILQHKAFLLETDLWQVKENNRLRKDLEALIQDLLIQRWQGSLEEGQFETLLQEVIHRTQTPLEAAEALIHS
jgi:LAO/AO transport system kinase